MRNCLVDGCAFPASGKYGNYCDHHAAKRRAKPKKWPSNEGLDRAITWIYKRRNGNHKLPGLKELSMKTGRPKWTLTKRARELGLSRAKESPWSEPEISILNEYAWMSDERIRLKLKRIGFNRTSTGIHLKMRRMRFKQSTDWYSARSLADAFGIDSHKVAYWISRGMLRAQRRGTARTDLQGGDMWIIREQDVWNFIRDNPNEFELRKVDQVWFMDLVIAHTKQKVA